MLTTEELYILPQIEEQVKRDKENYYQTIAFLEFSENVPLLHYTYQTIHEFENLKFMLDFQESLEEFAVNSYFFLLYQIDYYKSDDIQHTSCLELAQQDLLNIYQTYNAKQLSIA